MSGMTFLSDPLCLPIFESVSTEFTLERYTKLWTNFVKAGPDENVLVKHREARNRIKEYNGRMLNNVVVFDTEADKAFFVMMWS